jgi:DNA-binding CsgD family transcriptional regulator
LRLARRALSLLLQIDVEFERCRKSEMSPSRAIHSAARRNALSPRQLEVVKLIAADLTAKQTAARLAITLETANFHRCPDQATAGVKGTAGIVRWAIQNGVIEA